jgi:hypothetical protein
MIQVPVSYGELLDKISILCIKKDKITDPSKLRNVDSELALLENVRAGAIGSGVDIDVLITELRAVNEQLWDIENLIRECESNQDFGDQFIALARAVYTRNDRRAAIKRQINELLGSELIEEKEYGTQKFSA